MADWDPIKYLTFEGPRLRPALDLIDRVPLENPKVIYDLGCGTGNGAGALKQRWPHARVAGVDSSKAMLDKAAEEATDIDWILADIESWVPQRQPDLIFSNAALHWLDDHEVLLPRLFGYLNQGGVLAIQMPNNFQAPSHKEIETVVKAGPWAGDLTGCLRAQPVKSLKAYYDILAPVALQCDLWETTYLHLLDGEDAVANWTRTTALKPFLDGLDNAQGGAFFDLYKEKLARHYPVSPTGKTLFPFKRLFIVARKD